MRKPFAPKFNPETEEYWYDGRFYDEYPQGRYEQDLDEWAEEQEDNR
jgi:hypothetical protein